MTKAKNKTGKTTFIVRNDPAKDRVRHLNFSIPLDAALDFHEIQVIESRKRGKPVKKSDLSIEIFMRGLKAVLQGY